MRIYPINLNPILAALVAIVMNSIPLAAQDVISPEGSPPEEAEQSDLPLLEQLKGADSIEAVRIERSLQLEWSRSGSAATDLLLKRGRDALEAEDFGTAIEHLTALTDHAPDFAEGYHERARAYYARGLYGPALDDLKQVLILNPDHFDAMFGLGRMFEEMGDLHRASEVYIRVLDYHPNHTQAKEGQTRLRKSGIGRTL